MTDAMMSYDFCIKSTDSTTAGKETLEIVGNNGVGPFPLQACQVSESTTWGHGP